MVSERKQKIREIESPYMKQHEQQTEIRLRRNKGVRRRLIFFGSFFFILVTISLATIHAQGKVLQEKEVVRVQLEEQLVQLEEEQIALKQEIEHYNDLDYIAEIARRDYYLSKPGETIFKLP